MSDILDQINERKASMEERKLSIVGQIERDFAPLKQGVEKKLAHILADNGSRRNKVIKLQELVSEVRAVADQYVACKQGCSACCYTRVMMSQTEADAIGHKIGRPAVQLRPSYVLPDMDAYGKNTPCTFLENNACSIYEHRPFVCRNQVNWDVDSLLCGFENWELGKAKDPRFSPIPLLGAGPLMTAYQQLAGQDRVGDIRDFFPPVSIAHT